QADFVCPALSLHGEAFRSEVLVTESLSIFKAQSKWKQLLRSPYRVLRFNPVCSQQASLYNAFEELLLGRTLESLQFQLQKRNGLSRQFTLDKIRPESDAHLLSIKDLEEALSPGANHDEIHLIRALRELVV
ncbi:MAG: hypothetical protein AAF202_00040, partial [Pseudomonadota bacterium]